MIQFFFVADLLVQDEIVEEIRETSGTDLIRGCALRDQLMRRIRF